VRFLRQRWCWETHWCCQASRRLPGSAAAASAVLQGRIIGGPNPPCPYETAAAGPIRAPGSAGGVHERLPQARRHPAAVSPLYAGGGIQDGDPSNPPPSPGCGFMLKSGGFGQSSKSGLKVADGLYVSSHVTMCGFGQSRNLSANSLTSAFSKKPF
jgi:hypothetical protein